MGNIYSGMVQYLGYEESILSPNQLIETTHLNPGNIEEKIQMLQEQIDKNRDNTVTKDELKEYFEQLASKIDQNADGVITHDELETYVEEQIKSSKDEIEKWKSSYKNLQNKYEELLDQLRSEEIKVHEMSQISPQALKDYIKDEIINTDANLGLVPDALEKKIYLTLYKTIMKSLEGLFNTTSIDLLNHRISFSIQPVPLVERHTVNKRY